MTYEPPIPENRPGMSAVRPDDGPQEGELVELPEFDEQYGGF